MREFQEHIDWDYISRRELSEDIIREFQDRLNWNSIFQFQKLSDAFKIEFLYKANPITTIHIDNSKKPRFQQKLELGGVFYVASVCYKIVELSADGDEIWLDIV